jgi:glutathione S-transferase
MNYPWFAAVADLRPQTFDGAEHLKRWMSAMAARPAVKAGMDLVLPAAT